MSTDPVVRERTVEILEEAASFESTVRRDYVGRFPLELLQNAHDAAADAGRVGRVEFAVTPTALLVANEGVPFTYERVKSLLRLGASEKAPRRERQHMIGYKGIGFSSVFEICDAPQVISQGVAFGFEPALARKRISQMIGIAPKSVPVRPFAQQIDQAAWADDEADVVRLLASGAVTVIRLPLRADKTPEQIEAALERAIRPEVLLLMPAVDEIAISGPSVRLGWTKHRGKRQGKGRIVTVRSSAGDRRAWLVAESSIVVPKALLEELRDESWRGVRHLKVVVGLPWRGHVDGDAPLQPLHVYFPTDDALGRALLVHGDFYVKSNRRTIDTEEPGARINELLAERAARLAAELAASIARQGNPLLCALASQHEPSGFGEVVSERLNKRLAETRIVRSSDGRLRTPAELRRLGTSLLPRDEELLVELAGHPPDVLFPGDDRGPAGALLDALGMEKIDPDDLALLLDGRRTQATYGVVASLLARWLETVPTWDSLRRPTIDNLRQRPILCDTTGAWSPPNKLVLRGSQRVSLPTFLESAEAMRPPGRYGSQLLSDLRVEVMDIANAVKTVVGMVVSGRFGITGAETREVLQFLWGVWEATPERLEAERARLGAIRVPTRPAERGQQAWRAARDTYFSSTWLGDRSLEQLYGSFGQAEFLAETPPADRRRRARRRQFFATLGVADSPRVFRHTTHPWRWGRHIRGLQHGGEWDEEPYFQDLECPAVHTESMELEVRVADRLESLLDNGLTVRRATALGVALARSPEPYGPDAVVRCNHGSHPGKLVRRIPGYQTWLLETREWVPVSRDPAGASLRAPAVAWVDIEARDSWLALPRVALATSVRPAFAFASARRPTVDSLEQSLNLLAETFDDPEHATEELRRTARWLQERLDRVLRRRVDAGEAPFFLCRMANEWTWDAKPLIADVPGLENLDGLTLLPAGDWRGLRDAYRLKRASDVVSLRVHPGKRVVGNGLLSNESRAQILALITKRGADVETATRRLALIRLLPVASLRVEVSLNGSRSSSSRAFHLEVLRAGRRISSARLYYVPSNPLSLAALGHELADYISEHSLGDAIALLLHDASDALSGEAVSSSEVADALRAIENARRRNRNADDEEENPDSVVDDDADAPEVAGHDSESGSSEAPVPHPAPTDSNGSAAARMTMASQGAGSRGGTAVTSDTAEADARPLKTLISDDARFGQPRAGLRRSRPHRGPRPVSGASRRGSGGFIESDPDTEAKAMTIVSRYGREVLGAQVFDVHRDNKGWDLEFKLPDDSWQYVEVKGSSGDAAFAITRNERRAASDPEFRDRYALYWVANAGSPAHAEIRRFLAIGLNLTEDVLDPLHWEVFDWSVLPHEVIPLSEDEG